MAFERQVESVFAGAYYQKGSESITKFKTLGVVPSFTQNSNNVTPSGYTMAVGVQKGEMSSTWSGDGALCYDEASILSCIATTTSGDTTTGGVVGSGPSEPNLFNLYHQGMKATDCAVSGFSINGDVQQITTNVQFVGGPLVADGTTINTPTVDAPIIFEPQNTTVSIGGSPVSNRINAWSVEVSNMWNMAHYVKHGEQGIVQTQGEANFSLTLPFDSVAKNYLTATGLNTCVISNTTQVGTYDYTFSIGFSFYWSAPDSPSDNDNLWTITLKGTCVNNGATAITTSFSKTQHTPQNNGQTQGE